MCHIYRHICICACEGTRAGWRLAPDRVTLKCMIRMYIYIYVYVYIYIYTYVCVYIHLLLCGICMDTCIYAHAREREQGGD